ncbi:hypothetical protein ACHAWF_001955 [Thalassiosira exigua]
MRVLAKAFYPLALLSSPPPSSVPPLASAFFAAGSNGARSPFPARRGFSSSSTKPTATATATAAMGASAAAAEPAVAPTKLEDVSPSYKELLGRLETIAQLGRCQSVLGYDQQVFMPKTGEAAAERGAQMSALSGVIHGMKTDKGLLALIEKSEEDLKAHGDGTSSFGDEARLLAIERRDFLKNERVPPELAQRAAAHQAKAQQSWQVARSKSDFAAFEPDLSECFAIAAETAERKGDEGADVYSTMLDEFETNMPKDRIDEIFGEIKAALVPLLAKVLASEAQPDKSPLAGDFPADKQAALAKKLVESIGYDPAKGRIDVSTHPFTSSSGTKDVRITSRFTEGAWREGIVATLHEGGHAIYEQNHPASSYKIDDALSLGAHESQSLFWERHVALSKAFWRYAAPLMREAFGEGFDHSPEAVYKAVNAVQPSFIRVEADELTYPLHVILRYQIESDVVAGKLSVKDIPGRWNGDMKALLGLDVEDDAEGALQDIHWSALAIGYFPTYLIGAATAAQLEHFCRRDIPDFDDLVEKGEFSKLREWLTDKVHRHGSRYESLDDMLEAQLGEKLNPKYFVDYLTRKYTDLYTLE